MGILKNILAHPLTRGLDIDDPRTTALRQVIIRDKPFLWRIYQEWYAALLAELPVGAGEVLELGSGAGFFSEFLPTVITSEVFVCPGVRLVADGQRLPLADQCLRGIVMCDVMHHLPQPRLFFAEAARCVRRGGVIAMIEPWVTFWSRLIFRHLHHEPFLPDAAEWRIPGSGPLSGANGAMPWIILQRDRARFEAQFPQWRIRRIQPFMPLRYLLSGGVSLRSLMPGWTFPLWRALEAPLAAKAGMVAVIVLEKM